MSIRGVFFGKNRSIHDAKKTVSSIGRVQEIIQTYSGVSVKLFRSKWFYIIVLPVAVAVCILLLRMNQPSEREWVAIVNGDTISLEEYRFRFETCPHVGEGQSGTPKADFLESLVLERLFAQYAMETHLDTVYSLRTFREQLRTEASVERYLQDETERRVSISEEEIHDHFLRSIRNIYLDTWLISDSAMAFEAYERLQNGEVFSQLFLPSMQEQGVYFAEDMEFQWNSSNPAFEDIVYSLDMDEFSTPIFFENRWYLLHPVRYEQQQIPSRELFENRRESIRHSLYNRYSASVQQQVISDAMRGWSMEVDPGAFQWFTQRLWEMRSNALPYDNSEVPPMIARTQPECNPMLLTNEQDIDVNHGAVYLEHNGRDETWSLQQLMDRFYTSPVPLLPASNFNSFQENVFRQLIWHVEFQSMAQRANELHLERNSDVAVNAHFWDRHLLAIHGMRHLTSLLGERMGSSAAADTLAGDAVIEEHDEQITEWLRGKLDSSECRVNSELLDTLNLTSVSVYARKRHFPNRPATPIPVAYRWAMYRDFGLYH